MAEFTGFYKSPFGWIRIISSDSAILSVDFVKKSPGRIQEPAPSDD